MKVAVINFSGNVGKSTIAKHLLASRMPNAMSYSVETINADEVVLAVVESSETSPLV